MSLGAQWAGVSIKLAVDNDLQTLQTYRANHPQVEAVASDLSVISSLGAPLQRALAAHPANPTYVQRQSTALSAHHPA